MMENEDEIKRQAGEALLKIAYLRGHIPEDVFLDRNALTRWWDSLDEPKKSEILEDCATYIKAEDEQQKRGGWHKRKLGTRVSNTFFSIAAGLSGSAIVINISALDEYNDWLCPLAFFLVFGICFYMWVIRG